EAANFDLIKAVVDRQNVLGEDGIALNALTQLGVLIGALASLATGVLLAVMIGRWVAGAVQAMARDMGRLAGGDLSVDIKGDEHSHELGQMAKALLVFKLNAERVNSMAAEKEQQDLRNEELRQAMMQSLRAEFGTVVGAAMFGDLSKRVEAKFDDPELNELAENVNSLLATVEDGVSAVSAVIAALAEGDLTQSMTGSFEGAFAELQMNVDTTTAKLSDLVMEIQGQSGQITEACEGLQQSSNDVLGRAEMQAQALETTSTTMEEMASTAASNARNAEDVNGLAGEAAKAASLGGEVVNRAVDAMGRIEASSRSIADIINVINGIAAQTNLLALNAAVEAARAGEAGKGFAVVASEVGTLASRSSEAADQIKRLITEGGAHVSEGVALVQETGTSLEQIVRLVDDVRQKIGEISSASNEQTSGVEEVFNQVNEMQSMTQSNVEIASGSATAAGEGADGARQLSRVVATFQTSTTGVERAMSGAA
ncbi:MAG: methyl-accepting chemotaxis protein, partial [Pseudomonadota bacterium]